MELVRRERKHIDVLRLYIDVDVTGGLHGVGMEQHARVMADLADLGDRQDGADLVVGIHDGHKAGIRADGVLHLLRRYGPDGADGQKLDFKALLFQLFERVQHGMMLKCSGNDVLFALALAKARGGDDRLIIGFAAARGEIDLARGSVQAPCDAFARALQGFRCLLANRVQA